MSAAGWAQFAVFAALVAIRRPAKASTTGTTTRQSERLADVVERPAGRVANGSFTSTRFGRRLGLAARLR